MEIEVGEYIRAEGIIGKVEEVTSVGCWIENDERISKRDVEKHSKDIIDLIEVGDVCILDNNYCLFIVDEQTKKLLKNHFIWKELKILTHQLFENNCYKVVE